MDLNDLLQKNSIDPQQVLVLRHRPYESHLNKILPFFAAEKPDVFNAYQQTQGEKLEKAFQKAKYVASFIGHMPGKALFVGLYSIGESRALTRDQYWKVPAYIEMKRYGMEGNGRASCLWFDLKLQGFYASLKGKLVVGWPPPERSWWRRAHKNILPVLAILEDSALVPIMPEWENLVLDWEKLNFLETPWKQALSEWRGIYYIFDMSDGKGYVGSAYGSKNILGRWLNYAASGHGGNVLLRKRNPKNFQFSILQRVSPDMEAEDIIKIENTWKKRLHTLVPQGLNDN